MVYENSDESLLMEITFLILFCHNISNSFPILLQKSTIYN